MLYHRGSGTTAPTALIGCQRGQGKLAKQSKQRTASWRTKDFGGDSARGKRVAKNPKRLPSWWAVWCAGSRTQACRKFLAGAAEEKINAFWACARVLFGQFCTFARCFYSRLPAPSARRSHIAHAGTKDQTLDLFVGATREFNGGKQCVSLFSH